MQYSSRRDLLAYPYWLETSMNRFEATLKV
jgi:hypothetical protein